MDIRILIIFDTKIPATRRPYSMLVDRFGAGKARVLAQNVSSNVVEITGIQSRRRINVNRNRFCQYQLTTCKFSAASLSTKLLLFRAYCTPLYGCQLWCSIFQYSYRKLNVAYNDAFD